MPKASLVPNQPPRTERAAEERALSTQEQYCRAQAEAVHRVYALLYPERRIRIILKTGDFSSGDIGAVVLTGGGSDFEAIDPGYLGTVVFDDAAVDGSGLTGEDRDVTIVATIPRQIPAGETIPEKTAPDFGQKPLLQHLLWASPVLFEQAKYHYEMRRKKLCSRRHSFSPVRREADQPPGRLAGEELDTSKAPAILIGFHWLETGGAEKLAFDCVTWARAAGFRVLVVAERLGFHRHVSKLPDEPGVEFIRTDAYLPPDQWFEFLENLVRRENIRALHIHHNTRLYDNLMRLKAAFPDLITIDSTHIVEYADGGFPRTSGVWTHYIDHHHVISRDLVSFYLDRFGVSGRVMLGRMLRPGQTGGARSLPELRLNAGQKTCRLVFIGRMVHQKRAPLVVEIARKLHRWAGKQGITLQVDMVGTGAYLDVVRHMIHRSSLSDVITLHPADSDVPALLGKADILLLPSGNEGLALVCYEAIENGALPISTDVGGQSELVAERLLVRTSPWHCVRDSVARVQRLMTDPDFLQACKSDTMAQYESLQADPTAEDVLTSLYRDIVRGNSEK